MFDCNDLLVFKIVALVNTSIASLSIFDVVVNRESFIDGGSIF